MGRRIPSFVFDIQFFAEERTESATPKRRQKVRSEGKVCKSRDLGAAVEILTGLAVLLLWGPWTVDNLLGYFRESLSLLGEKTLFQAGWQYRLGISSIWAYFGSWLLLGILIAAAIIAVTVYQVGWVITFQPFKFDLSRMNPISGMKKIISLRSLVELLKGLVKASLFALVLYVALRDKLPSVVYAMQFPMEEGLLTFWDMLWDLSMRLALMFLVIGLIDYGYQKWDFEKSIRMSKQEIKDEYKQMEGDPQVKKKIRQKQRELARKRMMSSVPKADVVITNPTTLALALLYERELMAAPQVVAKGRGLVALKIREIAEENGVPVIENKPLARALYEAVEVGDEVPENLYRGVAEILAMVYKLKRKTPAA
jgi:flagellar biosynthetic protein FlhB